MSDISPREPWPGYADLSEDERSETLARKFEQAHEQNDQDYALALSAAVYNYELVLDLLPDATAAANVATTAGDLHDNAGGWQAS